MTTAAVNLWGTRIGAVSWNKAQGVAVFQYDPKFISSGIEVSPIRMPLSEEQYSFPSMRNEAFKGLPGMLADSLPDKFGNELINIWLAKTGRSIEDFNPVEKLCYEGTRGMGALEYEPSNHPSERTLKRISINKLSELADAIVAERISFRTSINKLKDNKALNDIIKIGTSAGGRRAKAIIALNSETGEIRSGQITVGEGYSYWILKFDGVSDYNEPARIPQGYGLIEYAYHKMAIEAGIQMTECRLLSKNGRNHFMTKRFDRTDAGEKIHMQTLAGMAHYDFHESGAYSYEQAIDIMRRAGLPMSDIEEQFRRTVFNILARNQDDHVKNISFLMDKSGKWSLSPAYDVMYSYNPEGEFAKYHQMSVNGKRDGFTKEDFIKFAETISLNKRKANEIIEQVSVAVEQWPSIANNLAIPKKTIEKIRKVQRNI